MDTNLNLLIEGLPLLKDLPPDALEELGGNIERRKSYFGEYLFREGEGPLPKVYFLISATCEIVVGPPDDEKVVYISGPGQLIGWLTVFTTDPFPVSAHIVESGDILQIPTHIVKKLMEEHSSVGEVFASTMARRMQDLFRQIGSEARRSPMSRAETFPFRKRASEVMVTTPLTLSPDDFVISAAERISEAGRSSAIVCKNGFPQGIVTEKDLVKRVLVTGKDPETTPVKDIMSTPVYTLQPDSYLYMALGIMRLKRIRHLAVVDNDRLVGTISMRILMDMSSSETLELVEHIAGAESLATLKRARQQSITVFSHLLESGMPAGEVSKLLSTLNRDIHRRVLEITMEDLEKEGKGKPPISYCFILMGSHGRGENHLNTDQDHGMILADHDLDQRDAINEYFVELTTRLSHALDDVGFTLCTGNVMSSNPVWRKPISEWKAQVRVWLANPDSNAVRYSTLFYDFLPIWGDRALARDLRQYITSAIQMNYTMLNSLFDEASQHKVPLTTFLKSFITEKSGPHKGQMDIKRSGLLFVVECARILALRYGVTETGTIERIQALVGKKEIPEDQADFIITSYKTLFHFLLTAQMEKLSNGETPNNYISPSELPIQERYMLRHALEAAGILQGIVRVTFGDIYS